MQNPVVLVSNKCIGVFKKRPERLKPLKAEKVTTSESSNGPLLLGGIFIAATFATILINARNSAKKGDKHIDVVSHQIQEPTESVEKELFESLRKDIEELKLSKADIVPEKQASNLPLYFAAFSLAVTSIAMSHFDNIKISVLLLSLCLAFVQACLDFFKGPQKAVWSTVARFLVVGVAYIGYRLAEVDLNNLWTLAKTK